MNIPSKTFQITHLLLAAASIAALMCACVKQPQDMTRNNLFDPGGSNWHPPAVTAINDTIDTVSINDSITISATGTDNGIVVKYVWAKNGTTYSDTTDSASLKVVWSDLGRRVVRVKAIDNDGVVSLPDSCIVTVILDPPVSNAGQDTIVSINDSIRLHGSATDRFGHITSWAWDIGNTGTFIIMPKGDTTIVAPASENLNYLCVLRVTDDDGNIAKDTIKIFVRQDVPVANAGNDTGVLTNDTILLRGSATQQFGFFVKWEWKIGSGSWTTTGDQNITVVIPDSEQTYVCSLAVTDDDGNRVVDERKIIAYKKVEIAAAGYAHSLILTSGGTLWACGYNWYGGLGNGTTTDYSTPVLVMSNVQGISTSAVYSMIIKTDSTLWACGDNWCGELGDGTTINRSTPVLVMSSVQSMAAGGNHSLILKSDGILWACGWNYYGQLGDGTMIQRLAPVQVMSSVQSVSAGHLHSLILKSDGTLWACGSNEYGQLGDGTTINRSTPVQVMSSVQSVSAGVYHSLILKSDGALWACGSNEYGQLGDGTSTDKYTPVQVMSDVKSMAAGGGHSLILKSDGTLWACGNNGNGQYGDGTSTNRYTPVQVMSGVQSVAAGQYHSLILKSDGTLWACGWNNYGQLGDGTTTDRHAPVRIIPPQ
jgi:alpha-tubulin suppressor-like RCC1 family protein